MKRKAINFSYERRKWFHKKEERERERGKGKKKSEGGVKTNDKGDGITFFFNFLPLSLR